MADASKPTEPVPNQTTSQPIKPLGPIAAALKQLFQRPSDHIRGLTPEQWPSPLQPVAPVAAHDAAPSEKSGAPVPPRKSTADKSLKMLPAKRRDFSDLLDRAHLTDKQRECLSLRLEYGFTVTEIATRLGRHRTSVDECLDLGKKKMNVAHNYEKSRKRRAIVEPDQFD